METTYRHGLLGILLSIASLICHAEGLMSFNGKSALETFRDAHVAALVDAVAHRDSAKAQSLVRDGANVNAVGDAGITPLIWMILHHNNDGARRMLEIGADPNKAWSAGEAPVYMAAYDGNAGLLNLLLDYHGDPNSPAHLRSAMMIAMIQGHFECAQLLVRRGANINFHDGFMLSISAPMIRGRFDWVVWMLENGYDYDLETARRMVANRVAIPSQVPLQTKALELIDERLAAQSK